MPMIGYLNGQKEFGNLGPVLIAAFRRGLGELGYVEGRNFEFLYR